MIPLSLWLNVAPSGSNPVHVWLPLFLVWLLLLPLAVVALVVAILADLVLALLGIARPGYTRFLIGCIDVLANSRGLVVRVHSTDTIVDLTID